MKIWLINHYAVPPQYYPLARPSLFAKNLIKMGHNVTIIAASTVHNSDQNLIEGSEKIRKFVDDGIPYVLIRCSGYKGNGVKRVINILEFAKKLPHVLDTLEKPDAVMATSFDPLSCYRGIRYAKKHGIKSIAEIADLWPETLVVYSGVSKNHPVVRILRRLEKNIYSEANAVVFTMEGAYDYIIEQGWEKIVPRSKVHYINNGIDLDQFDYNKGFYRTKDADLENHEIFKVVYAGAIRKINNLDKLLDIAKNIQNTFVRFLIWGDGDELPRLKERAEKEKVGNVIFKGRVEKKFIPYITSNADLNFAHNEPSPIFRFGISFNKIFDYLAAGKPILCDFDAKHNPVEQQNAGIIVSSGNDMEVAEAIDKISQYSSEQLKMFAENARKGAAQYDFKYLAQQLINIIIQT